jgi:hypothetical protein
MVQLNFNVLLWDAEQECEKLDRTAKPIYYSAYRQLSSNHANAANAARDNGQLEEPDRSYYLDWLAEEYREQCTALAAMTFALLWRAIKFHLELMTKVLGNRFPTQHPPKGKSELDRLVNEYHCRFGVRLEDLPYFATVREVVLARNNTLHPSNGPTKDYKEQTENRCLDHFGGLNLTPDLLQVLVEELKQFIRGLGSELSRVCTAE